MFEHMSNVAAEAKNQSTMSTAVGKSHCVLLDADSELITTCFEKIRGDEGNRGQRLKKSLAGVDLSTMTNLQIFQVLVSTLRFNGSDFEYTYGLKMDNKDAALDAYSVWEILITSNSAMFCPVTQYYGPLTPNMNMESTKLLNGGSGYPLLVVALIGDCVQEKFTKYLETKDKEGLHIFINPDRIRAKIASSVSLLLAARDKVCPDVQVRASITMVGSGAFGQSQEALKQGFFESLEGVRLGAADRMTFFSYGPQTPACKDFFDKAELSQKEQKFFNEGKMGHEDGSFKDNVMDVIFPGADPTSMLPHTMRLRRVSLEGQIGAATSWLSMVKPEDSTVELVPSTLRVQCAEDDTFESCSMIPRELQEEKLPLTLVPNGEVLRNKDCLLGWTIECGSVKRPFSLKASE